MLVTDDSHPEDLARTGHLNHLLRQAVSLGLDPLAAVTMATLNPAEYFRLRDRGAVAPGLAADLVVAEDLTEFRIDKVFKNGKLLVDQGRLLAEPDVPPGAAPTSPMHVKDLGLEAFSPPAAGECGQGYRPDSRPVAHRKAPFARARPEWPVGDGPRPRTF